VPTSPALAAHLEEVDVRRLFGGDLLADVAGGVASFRARHVMGAERMILLDESREPHRPAAGMDVAAVQPRPGDLRPFGERSEQPFEPVAMEREGVHVERHHILGLGQQNAQVHRQLVADIDRQQQPVDVGACGDPLPRAVDRAVVDDDDPGAGGTAALDDVDQHLEVGPRVPVDGDHRRRPRPQPFQAPSRPRPQRRHDEPPADDLRCLARGRAVADRDLGERGHRGAHCRVRVSRRSGSRQRAGQPAVASFRRSRAGVSPASTSSRGRENGSQPRWTTPGVTVKATR